MTGITMQRIKFYFFVVIGSQTVRMASDLRDGLSERALGVGFWAWHLLGLLSRDAIQLIAIIIALILFYVKISFYGRRAYVEGFAVIIVSAITSMLVHDYLYGWGVANRELFWW